MAPRVKSGQSAKRALAQPGRSMAQRSLSFACEVDLREAAFVAIAIASDDRGSRMTEIDWRCSTSMWLSEKGCVCVRKWTRA